MAHKAVRTEHAGAKNGGSAYWGKRQFAKEDSNVNRRHNDNLAVQAEIALMEEEDAANDAMWAQIAREYEADESDRLDQIDCDILDMEAEQERDPRSESTKRFQAAYWSLMDADFEREQREFDDRIAEQTVSPLSQEDNQDRW